MVDTPLLQLVIGPEALRGEAIGRSCACRWATKLASCMFTVCMDTISMRLSPMWMTDLSLVRERSGWLDAFEGKVRLLVIHVQLSILKPL